jgi:hypothetical protein
MTAKTRAFLTVIALALVSCTSLLLTASSQAAVVKATPTESLETYEQQLAAGQIRATVFNVKGRDIHVTLATGKHVIVHYPSGSEAKLLEALKAKGIAAVNGKGLPVKLPKAHKHKIRYIVGGVLVILVILVVGVLVIRRRRAAAEY